MKGNPRRGKSLDEYLAEIQEMKRLAGEAEKRRARRLSWYYGLLGVIFFVQLHLWGYGHFDDNLKLELDEQILMFIQATLASLYFYLTFKPKWSYSLFLW